MALSTSSGIPDWTDPDAYAPLLELERSGFAWEWLRREPAFCAAATAAVTLRRRGQKGAGQTAVRWHLHQFEDPRLSAPDARPVWTATRNPWVIHADAYASQDEDESMDIQQLPRFAKLVTANGSQRLLLSDGFRSVRLDIAGDELSRSPVRLTFELSGVRSLERPLIAIRRLHSLVTSGHFARSLYPRFQRARRMILLLRAFDADAAGASQAEIAEALLSRRFEHRRWRISAPSLRSQAQRLVRGAREMSRSRFWELLN